MRISKIITRLTLSMLLGSGVVVAADYGTGVKAYESGDYKAALDEWTPLAERGHAAAQYYLAEMYRWGRGVPENAKIAAKWYTKAAEQGDRWAQFYIGIFYENGEGVPQNYKTAVKWYTLSARQGDERAQYKMGVMYLDGTGVLTDNRRAYMWWNLASYNGKKGAGWSKDIVANKMTPADISKAQDMSSLCLESNYTDC
jgi:TPR repeat protein